MTTKLCC